MFIVLLPETLFASTTTMKQSNQLLHETRTRSSPFPDICA